eukprot:gene17626-biopygen17834
MFLVMFSCSFPANKIVACGMNCGRLWKRFSEVSTMSRAVLSTKSFAVTFKSIPYDFAASSTSPAFTSQSPSDAGFAIKLEFAATSGCPPPWASPWFFP